MSANATSDPDIPVVDIDKEEKWKDLPRETAFHQVTSREIARWVLVIFAGVYLFCFILALGMLFLEGATYEQSFELIKYMIGSMLPIVTLAVGYYLGDRRASVRP